MNDDLSFESLDALLGVIIEPGTKRPSKAVSCGEKPPKLRHTTWNNFAAFTFGGYVARVTRLRCSACDHVTNVLEGLFIEEVHLPSGTRKLTQMAFGTDWPTAGGHRKEVEQREVPFCGECIGPLGFDREVDEKGQPWALVVKEGV